MDQTVTVVIGNPPYRRVEREASGHGSGRWIIHGPVPGREGLQSLFDDIYNVAVENTIFSHIANLYNLYVYFWRWSIWKAFEAHGAGPGIVALITGASWLTGPGFMGLRQLARETCDEIWIIDLGGDNRGANPEENVFSIETPVAITILVRDGITDRSTPAHVNYRRIQGTAEEKLLALRNITQSRQPLSGLWSRAPVGWRDTFVPPTGRPNWAEMPLLGQLFPWQQPGCKFGRTWPIAPAREILERRWQQFASAPRSQKSGLFVTADTGRNVNTKVYGLQPLVDVDVSTPPRPIRRYGYRSFDSQWAFDDPRMANRESPSLWQSCSDQQLFLASLLTGHVSAGPSLTVTVDPPDLHFFRGSYGGKDIIPLYRDKAAREPNVARGCQKALGDCLEIELPTPEDLFAYVYAILSATAYERHFLEELRTPGLRVPITADRTLWHEVVAAGKRLLWLHTNAQRFRDREADRGPEVPLIEGLEWREPVTTVPAGRAAVRYDKISETLTIGDGRVVGVRADVWAYEVSGMPVVAKWLTYRTAEAPGRAASSTSILDRIRPLEWADEWNDELLDLLSVLTLTCDFQEDLSAIFQRVCSGALVLASNLPTPAAPEKAPPPTERMPTFDFD